MQAYRIGFVLQIRPLLAPETAKSNFDCVSVDGKGSLRVPQRLYSGWDLCHCIYFTKVGQDLG